jgi:hypothetical protein
MFKKVKVSFLQKGHTHEDIDQFFSQLCSYLNKDHPKTFSELMTSLQKAPSTEQAHVSVSEMGEIGDIKSFFNPYLEEIHNQTVPHHFVFYADTEGVVRVKCKFQAGSPYGEGEKIFRHDPSDTLRLKIAPVKNIDFDEKFRLLEKNRPFLTAQQYDEWQGQLLQKKVNLENMESLYHSDCMVEEVNVLNSFRGRTWDEDEQHSNATVRNDILFPDVSTISSLDVPAAMQALQPFQSGLHRAASQSYHENIPKLLGRPLRYLNPETRPFSEEVEANTWMCLRAGDSSPNDNNRDTDEDLDVDRTVNNQDRDFFWMCYVDEVNRDSRRIKVTWWRKRKSSEPWDVATWAGEWLNKIPNSEELPLDEDEAVMLFNIKLTTSRKLRANDVAKLRQLILELSVNH